MTTEDKPVDFEAMASGKRIEEEEKSLGLAHHDGPMRSKILRTADNLTCGDRNAAYGNPYDNMVKTANLWSDYLEFRIKPHEAATMMELLKIARTKGGPFKLDNYIDGSAYSSIAGECHWLEEQCHWLEEQKGDA